MTEKEKGQPINNLEDTSLVAYLVLKGHIAIPWRDTENHDHISFEIETDIRADIDAFYANEKIGIQDYVKCLKAVKSQMYNMKNMEVKRKEYPTARPLGRSE